MHAVKTSWPGRTFALANSNESGGKKTRIRRSKEERKGMVESFIKQYQCLNNGNFPSLSLTHREVGGSFYTVREIVREVIQENRVLGPGKWIEDEQKAEKFLEQHPLGSISIEPEYSLSISASGNSVLSHHDQGGSDKSLLVVECEKDKFDNDIIVDGSDMNIEHERNEEIYTEMEANGNAMGLKDESGRDFKAELEVNGIAVEMKDESDKEVSAEVDVNGALKDEIENEVSAELGVTMDLKDERVKDIKAEFEVNGIVMDLEDESNKRVSGELEIYGALKDESDNEVSAGLGTDGGAMETNELFEETGEVPTPATSDTTQMVTAEAEGGVTHFPLTSKVTQITPDVIVETFPIRPSISQKESKNTADMLFEKKSASVDSNSPLEGSKQLTPSDSEMQGGQNGSTLTVDVSHIDISTSKSNENKTTNEKATSSINGLPKTDGAIPGNATAESTTKGATIVEKNRISVQPNANSLKGSNATLNRINLESWEGTAKGKRPSETNPLLAIFKFFITAFVKFWSE